jgi:hypothetical protein
MDVGKTLNLIISAVPVAGQVVGIAEQLVADIKAFLADKGYDADTKILNDRIAEDVKRQLLAEAEAAPDPPMSPTA